MTKVELFVTDDVMLGMKVQSTGMLGEKVRVNTESSGKVKMD